MTKMSFFGVVPRLHSVISCPAEITEGILRMDRRGVSKNEFSNTAIIDLCFLNSQIVKNFLIFNAFEA